MRFKGQLSFLGWASLTLVLALARPAHATIMVPLTIEDMSKQSLLVTRAKVLSQEAAWDAPHERIYTQTVLDVLEPIWSTSSLPKQITVRTLGGEVGEIGMKVAGTPRFSIGEEVVVFLRADPIVADAFQVIGMSQGKFHIDRGAKGNVDVIPGIEGIAFARPGLDGTLRVDPNAAASSARIPFADLKQRILSAVRAPAVSGVPGGPSTSVVPR